MKAQYDYLTLILPFNGKEKELITEKHGDVEVKYLCQDYLTYHLQKIIGAPFKEGSFGFFQNFDFNKEIFIIRRKSYEIHFRGKFFLRESYELFFAIYECIVSLGYVPHLSRIDICFTGVWEFQDLAKNLLRSDFKNLEIDFKKKKKKLTYVKAHNVRFELLCYSKTAHLARLKDKDYIAQFHKRYGTEGSISRIEARLHNRHNLDVFTSLLNGEHKTFFNKALNELPRQILGRMKPTRKIMKIMTIAIEELKKSL
jgi:hypothetical protein